MKPILLSWARRGLLLTHLALGIMLLATSWSSYRGVKRGAEALARGQGAELIEAVVGELRDHRGPPSDLLLEGVLAQHTQAGLLYLAVLDRGEHLVAEAGERSPLPRRNRPPDAPPELQDLGDRYRMSQRLAPEPRSGRPRGPSGDREGRPGDRGPRRNDSGEAGPDGGPHLPRRGPDFPLDRPGRGSGPSLGQRPGSGPGQRPAGPGQRPASPGQGPGMRPLPFVEIEFEASTLRSLSQQTGRSLAIGAAGALMLTLAGIGFWRLTVEHEQAQEELARRKRLSALGEMTAVLAHEIRNPLASLKGNAQLLAEQLETREGESKKADRIVREASRLERLTSDLLSFSRSGALVVGPSDPADLLSTAAAEVGSDEIELDVEGAPRSWPLDPVRTRQVLTNLLRNAVSASAGEGVQAKVDTHRGELRITVRDHGPGIAPGDEERIFEPFFTTRSTGTGLGLAIARRIVTLHGGKITATNHPEGGAEFSLTIPKER